MELARRGGVSCGIGEIRSEFCRRGGGAGGVFFSVFFPGTDDIGNPAKPALGILIQSESVVGSNGFVGLFGLSCHPSPGGLGMSTFDDALLSSHHFLLSDDGGGTTLVRP